MSFTYAQLKQAIQDYTENDESTFVTNLPVFIRNAEEKILKLVQLTDFRKNAVGNLTSSNPYLNCPSDFLAPFSLSFTASGSKTFLDYKDVNFVQEFAPAPGTTGTPKYYAYFDRDNFIIGPTPDNDYAVELHYYYRPASLTSLAESGTSWLSENAPLTLLYGSLLEANIFMKGEPDTMASYQQSFDMALAGMKQFGESKEVTDNYRTGMLIRPKQ
jgi:hypothetical protein